MCSELALVDVAVEKLQAEKKDLADGLAFMKHRIVIKADVGRVICAFTGTTAAPVIKGAGSYLAGMAVAIPILNVDGRRHTNNFSKNI